ncbi:ATP-binding protein [Cryptosporangium sp. NPDC048952]|uniref:ATP-binding protein n=1 Tax=Cryptosporangium sp. NPDC048952 TaxID=3363961 RepID=UPI0037165B01
MTSTASTVRAAVGALVALLLLLGGARLAVGQYVASSVDQRVDRATDAATANDDLLRALTEAQSALRGYQLTGDPSLLEPYRRGLADYALARTVVSDAAASEPLRSLVAVELGAADAWTTYSTPLADTASRSAAVVAQGEELFGRFRSANARAGANFDAERTALLSRERTIGLVGDLVTALLAIVAIGLVLVLGRRARRSAGPVEEMRSVFARLETERAEARQRAHDLGANVRSSLDPDAIVAEVVAGLGALLGADHVYLRLADGTDRLWSRPGHSAPPIESFRAGIPEGLTTSFTVDADSAGSFLLLRGEPWTDDERVLLETVAADTGRGLHVAQVYDHQRELAERFQDLDRQKTDFISTVSHELRTPLTSILGYLEILLSGDQGEITDAQERSLKIVERNAERLRELVGDLLTLSRIGSGNLEMTATRVELAALLDGVREAFAQPAADGGLTIECAQGGDLAVIGDDRQLERVLANVVGNAVKFTPSGGSVRVAVRTEPVGSGERVVIEVVDTGMGIPEAEQDKLFQPFQRASNAVSSAIQGTGLGLAIARSIVERHGGEVTLESTLGKGTALTIALPRALGGPTEAESAVDPREAAIRAAKARALSRASAR